MDLGNIIWSLLDNPQVPEPYRNFRDFFISRGMKNEAEAIDHLIKERFGHANDTHLSK
jgi:hypothetical protein